MIRLKITRAISDSDGRSYLTFTPTFTPSVCASGSLSFAVWQVWENEPQTHAAAQAAAIANARTVLAMFGKDFEHLDAAIDPIPPKPAPTDAEKAAALRLQLRNAVSIMQQSLRAIDAHRRNSGGEGDIDASNIRGFIDELEKGGIE